ncbi:hypothetical protein H5410_036310, partial [Solanum commersonii]
MAHLLAAVSLPPVTYQPTDKQYRSRKFPQMRFDKSVIQHREEVLELRGQKLELRIIYISQKQAYNLFMFDVPLLCDGKETPQSNKISSVTGRLAVRAAK